MPRFLLILIIALVWSGSTVFGCAHPKPRPELARPPPPPSAVEKLKAGSTLVIPRPTPQVARIALWIDAGSRAAPVPQLATVAAYWAEEHTGASVRVLPDGTELSMLCDTQGRGVERCVQKLARVFALPTPSPGDVERLRSRLRHARQRALGDAGREAEELSVVALLGENARGFFPLGAESEDGQIDGAAVQRFAREQFGPSRSLLIAAGDVTSAVVQQAFASSTGKLSNQVKARVERPFVERSHVELRFGREATLALSLMTPSTEVAASMGQRIRKLYPHVSARITNLQGARLLVLRAPAGDKPARRLQRLVFDLRRLALEADTRPATRPDESLDALTRIVGEDWAARGPVNLPAAKRWPLGIALIARSESFASPGADTKERSASEIKKLQDLSKELESAVADGEQNSVGETTGSESPSAADVTTRNGVRIEVRRREGDAWMSAVVRFHGGSALDSPTRHGRAALLATLMADGCGFVGASGLDAHLAQLDARIQPLVSASHIGLMVTAPRDRWSDAIDAVLRCALNPALTNRALDDARLKLIRTLRSQTHIQWQSLLGSLLAPSAPGSIAPWGAPNPISSVHINEIRRLHADLLLGARLSLLAITDSPAGEVARFMARRVSQLPRGTAQPGWKEVKAAEPMLGQRTEDGPLRVLIGLRLANAARGDMAARVFAAALSHVLAARGLQVLVNWGDSAGDVSFAAAAVAVREEHLPGLDRTLREALNQVQRLPEATLQEALSRAHMEHHASWSGAQGYARAYFAERTGSSRKIDEELGFIRKFTQANPSYFILRPKP